MYLLVKVLFKIVNIPVDVLFKLLEELVTFLLSSSCIK